jgi:hypothetical protein
LEVLINVTLLWVHCRLLTMGSAAGTDGCSCNPGAPQSFSVSGLKFFLDLPIPTIGGVALYVTITDAKPNSLLSLTSQILANLFSELFKVAWVAVEFLRQSLDDRPGRHHLAVDHLKQLHRVDAQLSAQPEDVGPPGRAQSANMLAELIDLRLWHLGQV